MRKCAADEGKRRAADKAAYGASVEYWQERVPVI
jgi:hypothetical protein